MGNRANVVVKQRDESNIFLYTHWNGSDLPATVQRALKRHQRWNDRAYLTRIIFCEMVGNDFMGETGYGISTDIQDNEHPFICIDVDKQMIDVKQSPLNLLLPIEGWSFEEYCNLSNREIYNIFHEEE
jgi:hypothetical protein